MRVLAVPKVLGQRAGEGQLRDDWLANTRDPTPVCARSQTSQSCLLIRSQSSTTGSGLKSGPAMVSGRNRYSDTTVVWPGPLGWAM